MGCKVTKFFRFCKINDEKFGIEQIEMIERIEMIEQIDGIENDSRCL